MGPICVIVYRQRPLECKRDADKIYAHCSSVRNCERERVGSIEFIRLISQNVWSAASERN